MVVIVVFLLVTGLVLAFFSLATSSFYLSPNRYSVGYNTVVSFILSSFSSHNHFFTTLLLAILIVNISGNIPGFSIPTMFYFFSSSYSIPLWCGLILVVFSTQLRSFIAHMLPYGSPLGLMLVLPLIELFSQFIRPFTLMIRLSTNLSSGHIMMYMFSFFSLSSLTLTLSVSVVLGLLFVLELIISCLQAYIFSSLVYMYYVELL